MSNIPNIPNTNADLYDYICVDYLRQEYYVLLAKDATNYYDTRSNDLKDNGKQSLLMHNKNYTEIPNTPLFIIGKVDEEYYHQHWVVRFAHFINGYYNTRERSSNIKGEHKSN